MSITFGVATAAGTTTATGRGGNGNITVPLPASWAVGQLAILLVYLDAGAASLPNGWSQVSGSPWGSSTPKLHAFYKFLAASEPDPTTTISGSSGTLESVGAIATFNGVHPSSPIDVVGTASVGTGTPMTCGAVTTVANLAWALGLCGRGDNEATSTETFGGSGTGVSERLDAGEQAGGDDGQVAIYSKEITTGGTSTGAGSAATSATDPWVSVIIALKPAPINISVAEGLKGGDAPAGSLTIRPSVSEGMKGGDTAAGGLLFQVTLSEGVKGGDAQGFALTLNLAAVEGWKAGDTESINLAISAAIAEGLKGGDAPGSTLAIPISIGEGAKLGDSVAAAIILALAVAEGLKSGDQQAASLTVQAAAVEGVKLGDLQSITVGIPAIEVDITEGVITGEQLSATYNLLAQVAEVVMFGDSVSGLMIIQAAVTEGIKLDDLVAIIVGAIAIGKVTVTFAGGGPIVTFAAAHPSGPVITGFSPGTIITGE